MSLAKIARHIKPVPPDKPEYHYAMYEKAFRDKREEFRDIFEIGIAFGGSLRLWKEYFPNADVSGMDILDRSDTVPEGMTWYQGDQSKLDDLARIMHKEYDLILDDGSHVDWHIQFSLAHLFPYVKSGGYYVIEDLDCRRGLNLDGSCIKTRHVLKYLTKGQRFESPAITESQMEYILEHTESCYTYRSVCIIRKKS